MEEKILSQIYYSRPFRTRNADEFDLENILDLFIDPTDGLIGPFDFANVIVKGYIILGDYIENRYSKYDFDTQTFTISTKSVSNSKLVLQWIETLKNILINEGYFYGIICTEHKEPLGVRYSKAGIKVL